MKWENCSQPKAHTHTQQEYTTNNENVSLENGNSMKCTRINTLIEKW